MGGAPPPCGEMFLADRHHGIRRFTTCTDSVAAARSNVAPEIFRAITRTALLVQAKAVRSLKRVELCPRSVRKMGQCAKVA